jgi:general secretion pathway protein B
MSFILDALKKSESDRQRQNGPSLFEVKVAPPRRTLPIWALAIALLLGVNVIVVSWMLLRRPTTAQAPAAHASAAAPSAATLAATTAAAPAAGRAPGMTGARDSSPGAGTGHSPAGSSPPASSPPANSPPAAALASQPDQRAAQTPEVITPTDASAIEPAAAPGSGAAEDLAESLPLYQQIVTSAGLPPLHLDLHVFAQRPQDRFVMINMHRLAEGDSLPNGVEVETIRPDGVVLSYHGTRFLLPRD